MKENIDKINDLLQKIETLIEDKHLNKQNDEHVVEKLIEENKMLKEEYNKLKETSQEVINELNNSIQVIEDYFKKQNAHN